MALGKNLKRATLLPDAKQEDKPVKAAKKKSSTKKATSVKSTKTSRTKKKASPMPILAPQGEKGKLLSAKEIAIRTERRNIYIEELKTLKDTLTSWILFEISGECFAIEITKAQRVIPVPKISALPHTETYIVGVGQVRKRPILFMDLKRRFELKDENNNEHAFALVVKPIKDWVAILLEEVPQTIKIKGNQLMPVPESVNLLPNKESYIKYMHQYEDKVIYILDIDRLIEVDHGISTDSPKKHS